MNRREWACLLGSICSPAFPNEAVEALVDMLPLFNEWPDHYFTVETAKDIAGSKMRQATPAYGEILAVFSARRRDQLPIQQRMGANPALPRIEEPAIRAPTAAEIERVEAALAGYKAEPSRWAGSPVDWRLKVKPNYLRGEQLAHARRLAGIVSVPKAQDARDEDEDVREQN